MEKEYKVTRDGELWSNCFRYKEDAETHKLEQKIIYPCSNFEVSEMTEEELKIYY